MRETKGTKFITTQFVTIQLLDKIREEMKPDESLRKSLRYYYHKKDSQDVTWQVRIWEGRL